MKSLCSSVSANAARIGFKSTYAAHANNELVIQNSNGAETRLKKFPDFADFADFAVCALSDILTKQPHPPGNVTQPRADLVAAPDRGESRRIQMSKKIEGLISSLNDSCFVHAGECLTKLCQMIKEESGVKPSLNACVRYWPCRSEVAAVICSTTLIFRR